MDSLHECIRICFDYLPRRRIRTGAGRWKVRREAIGAFAQVIREQHTEEVLAFRRLLEFTAFRA